MWSAGEKKRGEDSGKESLWHNQTHYHSLSLPAVYAANTDKECAYIFPFHIRNARHWILNCCVTLGHIFPNNQAQVGYMKTGSTCFYTILNYCILQFGTSQTVFFFFFAVLCMSVFSILQQRCCGVLCFINNSVVQNAELNVTLAPDAALHGTALDGCGCCHSNLQSYYRIHYY